MMPIPSFIGIADEATRLLDSNGGFILAWSIEQEDL
jgi:hypothetical protein